MADGTVVGGLIVADTTVIPATIAIIGGGLIEEGIFIQDTTIVVPTITTIIITTGMENLEVESISAGEDKFQYHTAVQVLCSAVFF